MKSERRHELKTNTLAEALAKLPNTGRRRVTTSVTIALVGIAIFSLVRYRLDANAKRVAQANDDLAVAREEINEIKTMTMQPVDPSQPEEQYKDVTARLNNVLSTAGGSNPKLAAEALLARGDVNWNMAQLAMSTTQPSAYRQPAADLLKSAASAYQQVVDGYPAQYFSVATARFGLAAIAEDQQDWEGERKQYQAITDEKRLDDMTQTLAKGLLATVDQLQTPPLIAAPATQPATEPASLFQGPSLPMLPVTPATQP